MKTVKIATNKADCRFALVNSADGFAVYRECLNYAAHVRGGIARTWRYVEKGLTIDAAQILFDKKIAGKQKP